jgi:hypothetical protein
MTRRLRWWWIAPAFLVVVALGAGTAGAADRSKVDQATKRVEQGARQIGQGKVGDGFKEMFTGIGYTIYEGAKFSGETIGEFFKKAFG